MIVPETKAWIKSEEQAGAKAQIAGHFIPWEQVWEIPVSPDDLTLGGLIGVHAFVEILQDVIPDVFHAHWRVHELEVTRAGLRVTLAWIEHTAKCAGCGQDVICNAYNWAQIPDLLQRIEPGGIVPACQCPECGALAYLLVRDPDERQAD